MNHVAFPQDRAASFLAVQSSNRACSGPSKRSFFSFSVFFEIEGEEWQGENQKSDRCWSHGSYRLIPTPRGPVLVMFTGMDGSSDGPRILWAMGGGIA